MMLLVKIRFD